MTTFHGSQHVRPILSPEEAIVRDLITDRVSRQHQLPRQTRRHVRTALLLRRLAARLDPDVRTEASPGPAGRAACAGVHPDPRPWTAGGRPASARH